MFRTGSRISIEHFKWVLTLCGRRARACLLLALSLLLSTLLHGGETLVRAGRRSGLGFVGGGSPCANRRVLGVLLDNLLDVSPDNLIIGSFAVLALDGSPLNLAAQAAEASTPAFSAASMWVGC
jgi:hypothetical protein